MLAEVANPLDGLSMEEQSRVCRYIDTLAEHLGEDLAGSLAVRFGCPERHRDFVARVREEGFVLLVAE